MFVDLIVAHFDVIAGALGRKEPQQVLRLCRSCLTNKLPPLLILVASSTLEQVSSEQCIIQAFQRVKSEIDSTSSLVADFSQHKSLMQNIRQEFLYACTLHKLLPASSVPSILGSSPTQSMQPQGHYIKDDLVQQMRTNHARVDHLITEANTMHGNAEPIVQAIVEASSCYLSTHQY